MNLAGIRITESRYICESPRFLRWRRNHRKSRLNRKWHKKYGAVMTTCPGVYYEVRGQGLIMCPHAVRALLAAPEVIRQSVAEPVLVAPKMPPWFMTTTF